MGGCDERSSDQKEKPACAGLIVNRLVGGDQVYGAIQTGETDPFFRELREDFAPSLTAHCCLLQIRP